MRVPAAVANRAERALAPLVGFTVFAFACGSSTVDLLELVGRPLRWASLLALAALATLAASQGEAKVSRPRPPFVLGGALLALGFASAAWSVAPRLSFTRVASLAVLFVAAAALARVTSARPGLGSRLLVAMLAAAAAVAAAGVVVLLIVKSDAVQAATPEYGARYRGMGQNPNTMAALLAVALPLAAWQAWERRGWRRGAAVTSFLLLDGSIVASGSRGALLASFVALLVLAVAGARSARARAVLAAGVLALTIAGVGLAQIPNATTGAPIAPPHSRDAQKVLPLEAEIGRGDPSRPPPPIRRTLLGGSGRTIAWKGAVRQAADRSLLGYGFGVEERVFVDRFYYFYSGVPENSYLGLSLQLGALGLVLLLALALSVLAAAARHLRAGGERLLVAAPASVFVGGLVLALTQSYLTSVGNVATAAVWICAALATVLAPAPGISAAQL